MAGHVNLRDHANRPGLGIRNDVLEVRVRVRLTGRIGITSHLGVGIHLNWPRLGVIHMPMEHVELGQGHAVDLLIDLWQADEVAAGIDHDPSVWVQGRVLDGHGLLDQEASSAIGDDNLLQGGEGMESTPDGVGGDADRLRAGSDVQSVGLVHAVLQRRIRVGDLQVHISEDGRRALGLGGSWGSGEHGVGGDGGFGGCRHPFQRGDGRKRAIPCVAHQLVGSTVQHEIASN